MTEVDDNLNYLLGQLSVVTQEFNQIKTGLGEALDKIKTSFHFVQAKLEGKYGVWTLGLALLHILAAPWSKVYYHEQAEAETSLILHYILLRNCTFMWIS